MGVRLERWQAERFFNFTSQLYADVSAVANYVSQAIQNRINSLAQDYQRAIENLNKQFEQAKGSITGEAEQIQNRINQLVREYNQTVTQLQSAKEELLGKLRQELDESLQKIAQQGESAISEVRQSYMDVANKAIEQTRNVLSLTGGQISSGLPSYISQQAESRASQAIVPLQAQTEAFKQKAQQEYTKAMTDVESQFAESTGKLLGFLNQLQTYSGQASQQLNQAISQLSQAYNQSMAQIQQSMQQAPQQFLEAANQYQQYFSSISPQSLGQVLGYAGVYLAAGDVLPPEFKQAYDTAREFLGSLQSNLKSLGASDTEIQQYLKPFLDTVQHGFLWGAVSGVFYDPARVYDVYWKTKQGSTEYVLPGWTPEYVTSLAERLWKEGMVPGISSRQFGVYTGTDTVPVYGTGDYASIFRQLYYFGGEEPAKYFEQALYIEPAKLKEWYYPIYEDLSRKLTEFYYQNITGGA